MTALLAIGGAALFATQKGVVKWAGLGMGAWAIYRVSTGTALGSCSTCTPPSW